MTKQKDSEDDLIHELSIFIPAARKQRTTRAKAGKSKKASAATIARKRRRPAKR